MSEQLNVSVSALETRTMPVGTMEELAQENLNPATVPSCAMPNKAAGVLGCEHFHKCVVSAKAKAGPKNYGVQIVKGALVGGGLVRSTVDCVWIAQHHDNIVRNGGSLTVIAEEGETYSRVTSIAKDNVTGAQTMNSRNPNTYREEDLVETVVKPFARPGENKGLLRERLMAEAAQVEKERLYSESRARSLGVEGASVPLDKRTPRKDGGHSQSGGGKS